MKSQRGFSLIELLVCVVVIGILSAFAVLKIAPAVGLFRDKIVLNRLQQLYQAQGEFKNISGKRRFGKLTELTSFPTPSGVLVPPSVVKITNGVSEPIDGWVIEQTPNAPTDDAYLRNKYDFWMRKSDAAGSAVVYCLHDDGIVRTGTFENGCTRTSPEY